MSARSLLLHHPAGAFFTIAALIACMFPWIWTLPFESATSVHLHLHLHLHLRLGLFGFGAAAVTGYVLTALPAWNPRPLPVSVMILASAFLLGRGLALVFPDQLAAPLVVSSGIGLLICTHALRGAQISRLPIAAAPLILALAEAGLIAGLIPASWVALFMAGLILFVGGRAIPAFIVTEAARHGRALAPPGPLWLPFALILATMALEGMPALGSAGLLSASILWRLRHATGAGLANLLLAGAWGSLAVTLPLLLLADIHARIAVEHVFLIMTMGGTIFAFAGRAAMGRPAAGGLAPHPLQLAGFALILLAAPLRALSAFMSDDLGLILSGLAWSAGWLAFLACHLRALTLPTPFPVLSATREAPGHRPGPQARQQE